MPQFKDFNLSVNAKKTELNFSGQKIQIKSYLGVEEKASIISLAVRGALYEGIVSEVLMDAYFHIFIIENYTDIVFEDSNVEDILINYDKIISNGLLDQILNSIPEEEYNYLIDSLNTFKQQVIEYSRSYAATMEQNQESIKLIGQLVEKEKPTASQVLAEPVSNRRTRRTRKT